MGDYSAIERTDATWNPVTGCSKVSPGCEHCYAERLSLQRGWSTTPWTARNAMENVVLHPERLEQPLRWRKPRMVFVNSMSDLFHEAVPDDFVDLVFAIMLAARRHTFQVLTKRPQRAFTYLEAGPRERIARLAVDRGYVDWLRENLVNGGYSWPPPNVWIGVSVEDQRRAEERIPLLLQTPAAVRFLSCEPLLGPVDLTRLDYTWRLKRELKRFGEWLVNPGIMEDADAMPDRGVGFIDALRGRWDDGEDTGELARLDWVIVGGESGPGARPMDLEWARTLVRQCRDAGVAVFVKQLGARPVDGAPLKLRNRKGGDPSEWPEDLRVREYPEAALRARREQEEQHERD